MPQFEAELSNTIQSIFREIDEYRTVLAKRFYYKLIENIRSNKFGFTNKPSTIRSKGGRNTPMIDTEEYIRSIVVEDSKVFIKEGIHKSGISLNELGNMLEYGRRDRNFTGYPVWRLTIEQMKPILEKDFSTFIKNLSNKIKKR